MLLNSNYTDVTGTNPRDARSQVGSLPVHFTSVCYLSRAQVYEDKTAEKTSVCMSTSCRKTAHISEKTHINVSVMSAINPTAGIFFFLTICYTQDAIQ